MSSWGSTDPNTGQAETGVGQLWQGITGKSGPTAPRLPQGFEWMGPILQQVGQQAATQINYGPSNAAQSAGQLGTAGSAGLAAGINPFDVSGTFGSSLGSLREGMATGYLPDVSHLDALMRPGLDRSFAEGSAALREQNALTGNLAGSGAAQQITDYRAQLENQLGNNIAGIYGQAVPASIAARSGATQIGTGLPALLQQGLYGPMSSLGLQGQQFPLQALGSATGAVSGAPFHANQGSAGNGAIGQALGAYFSGGTGKGTGTT